MKTLAIYFVLSFWAVFAHAQEVNVLNEAVISFAPVSSEVTNEGDMYSFKVHESYRGEFEANPLKFMNTYFNVKNFISEVEHQGFDNYEVRFRSSKGTFRAVVDKEGNITKSSHRFKNVILPDDLRHQLYRDYKGWSMVNNVNVGKGKDGSMHTNFYKIKLENGRDTKRIRIDRDSASAVSEIVSN